MDNLILLYLLLLVFCAIYSLLFSLMLGINIQKFTLQYSNEVKTLMASFVDKIYIDSIDDTNFGFKVVTLSLRYKICSIIFCFILFSSTIFIKLNLINLNLLQLFFIVALLSLYLIISWFDFYYKIISNRVLLLLGLVVFAMVRLNLVAPYALSSSLTNSFDAFIITLILLYSLSWLAKIYYKQDAFGLGDVFLGAILVALHGLDYLAPILLLSSGFGILWAFGLNRLTKTNLTQHKIAFAPCLCLASYLIFIYN